MPKKGNGKECLNYCANAGISHASKLMLKILQARLQQYMNREPRDVQAGFRTRDQITSNQWIIKKQKNSRKTSTSASLTMLEPLTVWITANWKILQEVGIPDHLTCPLWFLNAGQAATVRIRHGTTDWFQVGKGVPRLYIVTLFI